MDEILQFLMSTNQWSVESNKQTNKHEKSFGPRGANNDDNDEGESNDSDDDNDEGEKLRR